jgi:hypothetical protein
LNSASVSPNDWKTNSALSACNGPRRLQGASRGLPSNFSFRYS